MLKKSCQECGSIVELNESDYTPGSTVSSQCQLCGTEVEFEIPEGAGDQEGNESISPELVHQNIDSPGNIVEKKIIDVANTTQEDKCLEQEHQRYHYEDISEEATTVSTDSSKSAWISILGTCVFAGLIALIYYYTSVSSADNSYAAVDTCIIEPVEVSVVGEQLVDTCIIEPVEASKGDDPLVEMLSNSSNIDQVRATVLSELLRSTLTKPQYGFGDRRVTKGLKEAVDKAFSDIEPKLKMGYNFSGPADDYITGISYEGTEEDLSICTITDFDCLDIGMDTDDGSQSVWLKLKLNVKEEPDPEHYGYYIEPTYSINYVMWKVIIENDNALIDDVRLSKDGRNWGRSYRKQIEDGDFFYVGIFG